MEVNFWLVIAVGIAVVLLIVYLVVTNMKDKKKVESDFIQQDIPPDTHDKSSI